MIRVNFLVSTDKYKAFCDMCAHSGYHQHLILRGIACLAVQKNNPWIDLIKQYCTESGDYSFYNCMLDADVHKKLKGVLYENGMKFSVFFRGFINYILSDPDALGRVIYELKGVGSVASSIKIEDVNYSEMSSPQIRVSSEMVTALKAYVAQHHITYSDLFCRYIKAANEDDELFDKFHAAVSDINLNTKIMFRCDMDDWRKFRMTVAKNGLTASVAIRRLLAVVVTNPDWIRLILGEWNGTGN